MGERGRRRIVVVANAHREPGAEEPRSDFRELAAALPADLICWDDLDATRVGRFLRRRVGFTRIVALLVMMRIRRYEEIWCFTEVEGLILAALLKLFRRRRRLYVIGIETLERPCRLLLKTFGVWTHLTAILPTNSYQATQLSRAFGVPPDKIVVIPYQVDTAFFDGRRSSSTDRERPLVVSVGRESRDFPTLLAAVRELDVDVHVAAASLYARTGAAETALLDPPDNVVVHPLSRTELRDLYARADLAVICLEESPYQHGITALQEAMAMGLPVVVSRIIGQTDVVIDSRFASTSNFADGRESWLLADNGCYVAPYDPVALTRVLVDLVADPRRAAALGQQARRYASEVLTVEKFVERCLDARVRTP